MSSVNYSDLKQRTWMQMETNIMKKHQESDFMGTAKEKLSYVSAWEKAQSWDIIGERLKLIKISMAQQTLTLSMETSI